jgi:hypothetical protein
MNKKEMEEMLESIRTSGRISTFNPDFIYYKSQIHYFAYIGFVSKKTLLQMIKI